MANKKRFDTEVLGKHYKKGTVDPYELFKSMTSSSSSYIEHLRTSIIKRVFRMFDKNQAMLDIKKVEYEAYLIKKELERIKNLGE